MHRRIVEAIKKPACKWTQFNGLIILIKMYIRNHLGVIPNLCQQLCSLKIQKAVLGTLFPPVNDP